VPNHLESVRSEPPDPFDPDDDDLFESLEGPDKIEPVVRPTWWRWVAIAVILAMILTGPIAYALSKLLD